MHFDRMKSQRVLAACVHVAVCFNHGISNTATSFGPQHTNTTQATSYLLAKFLFHRIPLLRKSAKHTELQYYLNMP
jgi:hypothetical protein